MKQAFAILEEEQGGQRQWVGNCGDTYLSMAADGEPLADYHYPDRETAERFAELLRKNNASSVEAEKRRYKFGVKTEPATYTVVPVQPYEVVE